VILEPLRAEWSLRRLRYFIYKALGLSGFHCGQVKKALESNTKCWFWIILMLKHIFKPFIQDKPTIFWPTVCQL
jgi:hypothetical protein